MIDKMSEEIEGLDFNSGRFSELIPDRKRDLKGSQK